MPSFISIGSAVSAPQGVEIHHFPWAWRMALTTVSRTNVLHCDQYQAQHLSGAGVTKIGLSAERQIGRSRSAHMLLYQVRDLICLTVGVVGRKKANERLVRRTPERPQQVVTATVVRAVVLYWRAGYVGRVRTLQRRRFQRSARFLLQYIRQVR